MTPTLLETRKLDNGTTLHLYDASRRQTADRWIVTMEIRLDIPVETDILTAEASNHLDPVAIREILGPRVTYVGRKERVFVPDSDKESLLQNFRAEFHRTALAYIAHPAFAARFIRKQYREACQKRAWQQALAEQDAVVPEPQVEDPKGR